MDFSAVCLDGMLGMGMSSSSSNNQLKQCRSASEMDMEQTTSGDRDWRSSTSSMKMARTESYVPGLMRSASMMSDASRLEVNNSTSELLESAEQQASRLMRNDASAYNKNLTLPFYQTGAGGPGFQYGSKPSAMVGGGMHAILAGSRLSPFTAGQWQELEHQALIFKYMMAGVQVPQELLIPLRKNHSINMNMNMNMNLFSGLSSGLGSLRPNLGWNSFHLGFANNADPEPGRCRRTDGKKWRCSRDAVPDQKYCERHMNRGRHRSRKPVEGQSGAQTSHHSAAAAATTHASSGGAANSSSATSLAAARSAVTPNNNTRNTNAAAATTTTTNNNIPSFTNLRPSIVTQQSQQQPQQQIGLKPSAFAASMDAAAAAAAATTFQIPLNVDRYLKGDMSSQLFETQSQSTMNSSLFNDNAWRSRMVPPKTTNNLMSFETRTLVDDTPDFGLGHMNFLPMTTTQRNNSEQQQQQQRPAGIRHFFDDWPSTTTTTTTTRDSRSAAMSWSEIEQMRTATATAAASSATQLSISIPIPSDLSTSSPASPNNKLTLSPLKLSTTRSDDLLGVDMGLGMGIETETDHHRHRQQNHHHHLHNHHQHHNHNHTNWIPITWESPVGGPLAEVLNSTTPHDRSAKNNSSTSSSSALNLGWDCGGATCSPSRGDTSPTGVLQKTLGSLSDSSTGSSPRAIGIAKGQPESISLCENLRTVLLPGGIGLSSAD